MAVAKKDDNREATGLALDESGAIALLKVDAVTNRVICDITSTTPAGGEVLPTTLIDDNRAEVMYGLADDGSNRLIPIAVDSRNGLIYCDILAE